MVDNPDEQIVITHPKVKSNGVATRRQLEEVHKAKGWVELKDGDPGDPNPTQEGEPTPAPVKPGGGTNG